MRQVHAKSIGLRRLWNSTTAGGGGFTPLSLFASGEDGAYYDISDLSTLWRDTGGTVQVTADGQSVARVDDLSGNGNNLIQGTASLRPVYKTDGTFHWLLNDGVDDFLGVTNIAGADLTVATIASAFYHESFTAANPTLERSAGLGSIGVDGQTSARIHMNSAADSSIRWDGTATTGGSQSVVVATDHIRVSERNGSAIRDWIDGVSNLDTTHAANATVDDFYIVPVHNTNIRTYAAFVRAGGPVLTDTERADLDTWLAARNNVTL